MHRRTLIQHATIVNEGRQFVGSLLIDNDKIEEILEGADARPHLPADEVVDARGCYLLPGVIDEHVHFREPGLTRKGDIESESYAAAAGGVTTYFDMPNTLPQTTTREAFEDKEARGDAESHVNYAFFFGATNDNAHLLHDLNPRRVAGIKLFMGSSTGNMLVDEDAALRSIFAEARIPIMTHCEDSALIQSAMTACQKQHGADPDVHYHSRIRSAEACLTSTRRAISLAREYGARLHVAHVSTAAELALFDPDDARITAEVCLPHLLFCEDDYARLGSKIKCNPSVKTAADRDALRRACADGLARTVATDHAPHLISEKRGGAARAASGMPMVQFALPAMLELVDEGCFSIERLVELMCHNPATTFQVENRGFLREGFKADLVLVRPRSPWVVTPNIIRSKCNWSPLEGRVFRWRVEKTYCNGFLVYNKGHLTDENVHGEAVTFSR